MKILLQILSFILLLSFFQTHAKANNKKHRKPPISTSTSVRIVYGFPSQNKDSVKIETTKAVIQDKKTGHIAVIQLEETSPDSATFSGDFSMKWKNLEAITPSIYFPPQELLQKKGGIETILAMIKNKQLKQKAFVFRKHEGHQFIDVYDSKKQALAALNAYKSQTVPPPIEPAVVKKNNPALELLDTAQLAKEEAEKKEALKKAAEQELERIRLEQLEKQKALDRQKAQERLKAEEIARRKQEAEDLAKTALKQYRNGEFEQARELFSKSVELDPKNTTYYYQYGITLYKTNNFNKSVVILKMAQSENINAAERDYYIGLSYYKLNEKKYALEMFREVKKVNHKILSPSAAFYEGVILFEEHIYPPAKEAFQYVLDTSEDPRMDERAERYIEQIARLMYYAENKAKTFILTGSFGTTYDTNVLLLSDATLQQDTASDQSGIQLMLMGGLEWRPLYEKQHEWSTKLSLVGTSTWNTSFLIVDSLRTGDIQMATLSFPYVYKGLVWGKGYKLLASPSIESVSMDPTNGTSPTNILNSYVGTVSNTFIMSQWWFSLYDVEFRQDNSLLTVTDSADNSTGTKFTVKSSQMYFFDRKRTTGVIGDLGVAQNSAKGQNNNYSKIDLGITYLSPIEWSELSWMTKVGYYQQQYPNRSTVRTDNNTSLSSGVTKKFTDWMGGTLAITYTNNASNTNQYSKLTIAASMVVTESF